jgi:hypothetical protein
LGGLSPIIYVASSWRSVHQPDDVAALRAAGFDVYDFRHPAPGDEGFNWRTVDPGWTTWTVDQYRAGLQRPVAIAGYTLDMQALEACDTVVLVLPCGRSAHLEAGWAKGAGKRVVIDIPAVEPELMYCMADAVVAPAKELLAVLRVREWPR